MSREKKKRDRDIKEKTDFNEKKLILQLRPLLAFFRRQ